MLRHIAGSLAFIILIGSTPGVLAAPLDSPDVVYIDGVPCNRFCQAYMAWSREVLAATSGQGGPRVSPQRDAGMNPSRSRRAARDPVARRNAQVSHSTISGRGRTAMTLPQQTESSNTARAKQSNDRPKPRDASHADTGSTKQTEASKSTGVETPSASEGEVPGNDQPVKATTHPPLSTSEQAEAPGVALSEPSTARRTETPTSPEKKEVTGEPRQRSVREQMIAATTMAEQLSDANDITTKAHEQEVNGSASQENNDGDRTASLSRKTDALVALIVSRPEIKSMADLTGEHVAINSSSSVPDNDVRTALVAAGAQSVELSTGNSKAIDRLVDGEVPAAVMALISPDAADAFPDIPGFKVFRIPLSPLSTTGTDTR